MKLQTISIFLFTTISLTGQGIMLAGGAVAETGEFAPTDISNCFVWLSGSDMDGDDIENEESSGAATPSTWVDKTGNGHNFTKAGNPTISTKNGNNVVDFDGSGDYYVSSEVNSTWTFLHDGTKNTIFLVVRPSKSTTYPKDFNMLIDNTGINSANRGVSIYVYRPTNRFTYNVQIGVSSTYAVTWAGVNTWYATDEWKYVTIISDPSNATAADRAYVRMDAIDQSITNSATATPSSSDPNIPLYIGWSGRSSPDNYLNGYIGEIIIYDRALTMNEITQVENYLSTKYGL